MIRVFLVDEIRLMCEMMTNFLKGQPDIQVIGSATDVDDAMVRAQHADILLVSSTLPAEGALKLSRAFKFNPSVRVIVVGLPESQAAILRYIEAGAVGYVCSENSIDQLIETIRSVRDGRAVISPELAAAVIARVAELAESAKSSTESPAPEKNWSTLTTRENQVLALVAQGLGNQEIAERLTIELGTAKNHVHKILRKLCVKSREEAAACFSDARLSRSDLSFEPRETRDQRANREPLGTPADLSA